MTKRPTVSRVLWGPTGSTMPGWEAFLRAAVYLLWMAALGLPWLGAALGSAVLVFWVWDLLRRDRAALRAAERAREAEREDA